MQFFLVPGIIGARGLPFRGCLSRDGRRAVGFLGLGVESLKSLSGNRSSDLFLRAVENNTSSRQHGCCN
jgi:hypothetical protein